MMSEVELFYFLWYTLNEYANAYIISGGKNKAEYKTKRLSLILVSFQQLRI